MLNQKQVLNHNQIRTTFLNFFEKKGHVVLNSFSLIPENDPSLLFVAAGMVPFKAEFAGKIEPKYKRISTCQKCFRMDDIDNVGWTLRHHTFFEMLGNFSFGDYFKRESIEWAYELLTEVYKIDSSRLYFSCHPDDDEAEEVWLSLGVKKEKIVRLEDNFWGPAGPTGPCGPSSEIFYENFHCPNPLCKPGYECKECEKNERFIEIWNIVFTQYFKESDGSLSPLPQKNIDTGMGLERLTKILQEKPNQYQTDLFLPIISRLEELVHKDVDEVYKELKIKYNHEKYLENREVYKRIVADHIRGAVFLLADGVVPSNEGRGYVLRKLIRRALLYSRLLGIKTSYLNTIPDIVEYIYRDVYSEISSRKEYIKRMLENEENGFSKNLSKGMDYLSKIDFKKLTGKDAFFLYDTLGFPIELTLEISKSQNFIIDLNEFYEELEIQKQRSRQKSVDIKIFSIKEKYSTSFVGYDHLDYQSKVIGILKREDGKLNSLDYYEDNDEVILVVEETPFYPESGGQVGDKGRIFNENFTFIVDDTQKHVEGFVFHIGRIVNGFVRLGDEVHLSVDKKRRKLTAINHTATHLLHSALRKILGHHVYQAGSLVDYDKLRFDFTHFDNLSDLDVKNIEDLVNEKILENIDVEVSYKPLRVALDEGAIALFAEKYPDLVRTVRIGGFSYELCGGTHVKNTSVIGIFKIVSSGSVQMGVKRLEAITSLKVLEFSRILEQRNSQLKSITKQEENNLINYVSKLMNENKELAKKNRDLKVKFYRKYLDGINFENKPLEFEVEEEEDMFIIHDIIKLKQKYFAFYKLKDKKIAVFHKDFVDYFKNLVKVDKIRFIPLGDYFRVVI
ncbi:MAG: alanine--tRNA ligase [Candidatus Calescibacterium sp.]|nr:alanine--tRNA ligase [Candidatus Calescibacterium sp.]MDW8132429.1 alanine--tRNA ligase [Candidatus Calescibacterium sp.]